MPTIKKTYIVFALLAYVPILLFAIVGFANHIQLKFLIKEIVEFFIFSSIIYALGVVLFKGVVRLFWFYFSLSFLYLVAFLKTAFFFLYQSKITISAFYIIFETTGSESSQFLATYFDFGMLLISVVFLLFLIITIKQVRKLYKSEKTLFYLPKFSKLGVGVYVLLILGIVSSIVVINLKLKYNNILFLAKDAYTSYSDAQILFQTKLVQPVNDNLEKASSTDEPQTFVVVIGESTSSRNMGLYGYYRNTNPLLSEIDDELLVFKDVIAPHTHTITSLNKVLSFSNYENPDVLDCGSIVQLANAAGFSTYWISNQKPIGINETLVTAMSKASKEQFFTNALTSKQTEFDEAIFPIVDQVLSKEDHKKVIFIHLAGTHVSYRFSYPPHFKTFSETPKTNFPSSQSTEEINHYDNAIVYNDFILRTLIEKVREIDEKSYVMYFSDHGDEVFQDINFVGHSEYHGTNPMYEIPFIIWASEKLKKDNPKLNSMPERYLDRKYMLDDFIYSFSDLSKINFEQFQPERSIFNQQFLYRKRMLNSKEDYDTR